MSVLAGLYEIRLRWPGRCRRCGRELAPGSHAFHDRGDRSLTCPDCVEPLSSSTGGASVDVSANQAASDVPTVKLAGDVAVGEEKAGASALREYERRRLRREAEARERLGGLGVVLTKVIDPPQATRAWKQGGDAEVKTAARLAKHLEGRGVRLLHDRRVRGHGHANIDHILIGPAGVMVVDTKAVRGRVQVEQRGGLFSRRLVLLIGGRDCTPLIEGLEKQMGYVRAVLQMTDFAEVEIRGALCFPNPDGLPALRSLKIGDVLISGPKPVAKQARRAGPMVSDQIDRLWRHLDGCFPSA
jgi:Nuclease-related domain